MTVYLVTDGEYDDYHVVGICSTLEKAGLLKKATCSRNDIRIMAVDNIDPRVLQGYLCWSVLLDVNGKPQRTAYIYNYRDAEHLNDSRITRLVSKNRFNLTYENSFESIPTGNWVFYVWAKTEEEAIEEANKERILILEKGEW